METVKPRAVYYRDSHLDKSLCINCPHAYCPGDCKDAQAKRKEVKLKRAAQTKAAKERQKRKKAKRNLQSTAKIRPKEA